jgi:hypothetical protein
MRLRAWRDAHRRQMSSLDAIGEELTSVIGRLNS